MSQPILTTSLSGISNLTSTTNKARLSYSSLRTSGDNGINNLQIQENRLSTPNVHTLTDLPYRGLPSFQPDVTHALRHNVLGRQERLSQPTLITGDCYPSRVHQRLSQPCLSTGRGELSLILHSPVKHKRFGPSTAKLTQRDRLSQLDFGARYRNILKDSSSTSTTKFNRDRLSIPELQTSNDLRLIAGTPKQRFSLDSALNEPGRSRLLPIASSPISENNVKSDSQDGSSTKTKNPADGLESVLITSTTPIIPNPESAFPSATMLSTVKSSSASKRERLSVPEIRNSSLRRLLDMPIKQRHSLTGNLKQCLLSASKGHDLNSKVKSSRLSICKNVVDESSKDNNNNGDNKEEPKHIQRYYAYTCDAKEETALRRKLNVCSVPRKKYLESSFDRNEQVITTVIETEVPMILSSPKYMKKTHAYSSETPRWMKKYLENEGTKTVKNNQNKKDTKNNLRNSWINSDRRSLESVERGKVQPEKAVQSCSSDSTEGGLTSMSTDLPRESKDKTGENIYVKIKDKSHTSENTYDVSRDSSWTEADICRLYGPECDDTDTDESTSV